MRRSRQRFTPRDFEHWLRKQIGEGAPVAVCCEAGCFGYEPARQMKKTGARVPLLRHKTGTSILKNDRAIDVRVPGVGAVGLQAQRL
jgi:hypothetical protein